MIKFRPLQVKDVSQSYVLWFSNKDVVKYSDNQYRIFTLEGQKLYVEQCIKDKDIDLYGIFYDDIHIGNISLSNLTSHHKRAELTYCIGITSYWGKGIGRKAISEMITVARNKYQLKKLYAGVSSLNYGSKIALEHNNFLLEGVRKDHLFYNSTWSDQLDYGLIL
ncbi:GNAT family protein [Prochlorococcus sp. MIT 1307]|uniref:GNAT family N-acetyltransferase n=1 Tax=Prochlorococcus sp. MIT 1307 TaxID=3096219 RepID=UPI002A74A477|nr:GNAT family protein [Prochlorococcus sp. MIT 1307]